LQREVLPEKPAPSRWRLAARALAPDEPQRRRPRFASR